MKRRARAQRSLYQLVKKVHMYLGLLNFSNLLVFGVAGLTATFSTAPGQRARTEPRVRYESFVPRAGASDKQIADGVHAALALPLTAPLPEWAIKHDDAGHLQLNFYTPNGPHRVTVLPEERRVRVETTRNDIWHYLSNLHSMTIGAGPRDWRVRLWTLNTELAIWSLIAMAFSGLYLWLATRPRYRLALNAFLTGSGLFLLLYALTR